MHEVACEVGDVIVVGGEPVARVLAVSESEVTLSVRGADAADDWSEMRFEVEDDGISLPGPLAGTTAR